MDDNEICAHCADEIDDVPVMEQGYPFCSEECREAWIEEQAEDEETD
jgi:endogenous inhibitor of DNA gyrase (YacG/DUF329 family)